jgi:Arc/MetJ-type ribon-helix-helix transcriptional regulator
MKLREYLENQIQKGKIEWESRSELIRASGSKANGNTNKILKEYENKFKFGSSTEIKNKEIKKYFDNQPKNSFISVEGAANQIQKELPKGIIIGETIIYNRLKDPTFNTNNLKPQTLDNQVSKTAPYDVKISKEFREKLKNLREAGVYLYIEVTQRGGNTLRLKTGGEFFKTSDNSYPPNDDSLKLIKKIIEDNRK